MRLRYSVPLRADGYRSLGAMPSDVTTRWDGPARSDRSMFSQAII